MLNQGCSGGGGHGESSDAKTETETVLDSGHIFHSTFDRKKNPAAFIGSYASGRVGKIGSGQAGQ